MAKSNSAVKDAEEELNKFRVEVSLVIVGLFLALGVQNVIQFVEVLYPHITAYFFLALGVGSIVMVLVFLKLSAEYAGLDPGGRRDGATDVHGPDQGRARSSHASDPTDQASGQAHG